MSSKLILNFYQGVCVRVFNRFFGRRSFLVACFRRRKSGIYLSLFLSFNSFFYFFASFFFSFSFSIFFLLYPFCIQFVYK
nr:MAG TPA: hypothetical protein [Bacteriophage sp.]